MLCLILIILYRPLLAQHWRIFRTRFWRNAAFVVAGAIAMQIVVSAVRAVVPNPAQPDDGAEALLDPATAAGGELALLFSLALGPLAIVMVEEAVFRHTLLVKLPLWGSKALAVAGVLLNGAIFGAIHYQNFGSLQGTVPFMVVGVLFNLVYLWKRNLWHVILMHLVNNFVLTYGALILVVVLRDAVG